jgi:uncharacterized coiled-coil protein SlyX
VAQAWIAGVVNELWSGMAEDRLEELEIKLAFQDKLIRDLDALVRTFGDRLDGMKRELDQLKKTIESPELPVGSGQERPPHY